MSYEFTPLLLPFTLATGCVLIPWYFSGRLSDERFRTALLFWTVPVAIWSLAVMLRVSATTVPVERLWHNVRFVGPAFGTVGYFLFTAVYTDHDAWFQRPRLWLLFVMPVLTSVMVWTNSWHMLVRASTESATTGPFVMSYTPGPWFVVHTLYSYALVLGGSVLIVRRFWEYRRHVYFRGQTLGILLGVLVVMAANLAFNLEVTVVDWTPVAGALAAIIFTVAALEYRFLDLSPLARETVIENMERGMMVTNADGQIIDINGRAVRTLDVDSGEAVGSPIDDVFITSRETIEALLTGSENTTTVEIQRDETRYYDISVSPVSTPSSDDVGMVITFSEVTTRVEREHQLQEQKRSLERQNDRLEEFTSVVSHDLRNPLSVAHGRIELAQQECESEHLAESANALDRMETLIDDLLTLTREGERVDERETVDLGETVDRCWRTVETADVTLVTETDQTIMADPNRVQQLLENLFRNAVEHGGESVTVTVGELDGGFYVADNGPGIPDDERDQVFDSGYSTAENGTGLGLNIVQEIAGAHGWDITVTESETGGARFEITGVTQVSADE